MRSTTGTIATAGVFHWYETSIQSNRSSGARGAGSPGRRPRRHRRGLRAEQGGVSRAVRRCPRGNARHGSGSWAADTLQRLSRSGPVAGPRMHAGSDLPRRDRQTDLHPRICAVGAPRLGFAQALRVRGVRDRLPRAGQLRGRPPRTARAGRQQQHRQPVARGLTRLPPEGRHREQAPRRRLRRDCLPADRPATDRARLAPHGGRSPSWLRAAVG